MLYKYKDAFSLRDKIGTCPNIEVGIEVTDKSLFCIRPYYVREEDKKIIDKEMKCLNYVGIWKEGFSPYSSPVMLISHKLTQDKRVVTDFRHLNVRIAKTNLAYPLVRDTFLVLGNCKCEVLLVLDLEDCVPFVETFGRSKEILRYFTILWECIIAYLSKKPYGTKYIPLHLAIIYKCNFRLFGNQKTLWSDHRWFITFHPHKESTCGKIRRFIEGFAKEWD